MPCDCVCRDSSVSAEGRPTQQGAATGRHGPRRRHACDGAAGVRRRAGTGGAQQARRQGAGAMGIGWRGRCSGTAEGGRCRREPMSFLRRHDVQLTIGSSRHRNEVVGSRGDWKGTPRVSVSGSSKDRVTSEQGHNLEPARLRVWPGLIRLSRHVGCFALVSSL